jgi:hypothetical protein
VNENKVFEQEGRDLSASTTKITLSGEQELGSFKHGIDVRILHRANISHAGL